MKNPAARFWLRREARERTCREDGGDQWRRVQFAAGHAQVATDAFTRLKERRGNDRVRYHLR